MRLGFIFIHAGIWMHYRVSQISTIKQHSLDMTRKTDSFDNNVWAPTLWKRFNYIAMSVLTIIL